MNTKGIVALIRERAEDYRKDKLNNRARGLIEMATYCEISAMTLEEIAQEIEWLDPPTLGIDVSEMVEAEEKVGG